MLMKLYEAPCGSPADDRATLTCSQPWEAGS